MAKKVGHHVKQKIGRCIFCGQKGGLTKTHIWPDWLNRVLPVGRERMDSTAWDVPISPDQIDKHTEARVRQGGIFSQKPYLACDKCNNEWMSDFEPKIKQFAIPLFTSMTPVQLTRPQLDSFSGWICLIAMLAEYNKNRTNSCIPKAERRYLKEYLEPPDTWSIFVCSSNSSRWYTSYSMYTKWYDHTLGTPEFVSTFLVSRPINTQISSFGFGNLFVQAFSSPYLRLIEDFRASAKSKGLLQIWPKPSPFNPFAKRSAKFPTKLVLDDDEADLIAEAFSKRFDILYGARSVKRFRP